MPLVLAVVATAVVGVLVAGGSPGEIGQVGEPDERRTSDPDGLGDDPAGPGTPDGPQDLDGPDDPGDGPRGGSDGRRDAPDRPGDDRGPTADTPELGVDLDPLERARTRAATTRPACVLVDGDDEPCGPTVPTPATTTSDLAATEGALIVQQAGEVSGFGLPGLAARWRTSVADPQEPLGLRTHEDTVVVTTPTRVLALDADLGDVRWETTLDAAATRDAADAWVIDGAVMVLAGDGSLHTLDADDGTTRWQQADVGRQPVATPQGLVVFQGTGAARFEPDRPEPVWALEDALLEVRRPVDDTPVPGPIPLTRNRGLLDLASGAVTEETRLGVTRYLVRPQGTIELRWPTGTERAEVALLAPDGATVWRREDQPIRCCLAVATRSGPDEIAITATGGAPRAYDLEDGGSRSLPSREDAELVGLDTSTVLWRLEDRLIGDDRASGQPRFRADGQLRSVAPLLIAVDDGLVVPDDRRPTSPGPDRQTEPPPADEPGP